MVWWSRLSSLSKRQTGKSVPLLPQDIESRDEDGKKQYLVVAVDTVSDRTISFDLIDSRDSDAIKGFLKQLEGGDGN